MPSATASRITRRASHRGPPSRLLVDRTDSRTNRHRMKENSMRVFLAGGAGAIGTRLIPQLVNAGHAVVATTRNRAKFDQLAALGAEPVQLDGLDAAGVGEAVAAAEPDAIVHQMTALGGGLDLRRFERTF